MIPPSLSFFCQEKAKEIVFSLACMRKLVVGEMKMLGY